MFAIWAAYFFGYKNRSRNFTTKRLVEGARVVIIKNKRLQKILRDEGTMAFAMPGIVFVRSTYVYTPKLLRHELMHVEQFRREGLLFAVKYTWHDWFTGYDNNPYEIEARAAE